MLMTRVASDLTSAWIGIRSGRWGSIVAVAALALGIGASTTASAVAYGGLLRPLPFPDDSQLITLEKVFEPTGLASGIKLAEFDEWHRGLGSAATLSAFTTERVTLRGGGAPQDARAAFVIGNWFQMLGARPLAGRFIDDLTSTDEAVVSEAFADRQTAGVSKAVLGRTFTIGTRPVRVVGILPASFKILDDDIWVVARGMNVRDIGDDDARTYRMAGRVARGRSIDAARAAASATLVSLAPEAQKAKWQLRAQPLRDRLLGESKSVLIAFLAASALVLLVACANVAILLVNRAVARAHEFSVRVALGASRGRLLVVATLETAMLALAGLPSGGVAHGRGIPRVRVESTHLCDPAPRAAPSPLPRLARRADRARRARPRDCAVQPRRRCRAVTGRDDRLRANRRLRGALVVMQLAVTVALLTAPGCSAARFCGLTCRSRIIAPGARRVDQRAAWRVSDPASRLQRPAPVDDTRRLPGDRR
jgi:hypothetical protein